MSKETSADSDALLRRHGLQVTAQRLAVLPRCRTVRIARRTTYIRSYGARSVPSPGRRCTTRSRALTDKGVFRRIQLAGSSARYEKRGW